MKKASIRDLHTRTAERHGTSRGLEQAKRGDARPMREFLETLAKGHGR